MTKRKNTDWKSYINKKYPDCKCIFCRLCRKGYSLYTIGKMTNTSAQTVLRCLK
jgi:hypothetical protein